MLFLFGAQPVTFRTGWFIESVVSAASVVLVVRSRRPLGRSRPGRGLSRATAFCLGALVASASAIVAAPQTTITPGQMTQAHVWIQNRGSGEAVPVDLRDINVNEPLRVQVINADVSHPTTQPIPVRIVRPATVTTPPDGGRPGDAPGALAVALAPPEKPRTDFPVTVAMIGDDGTVLDPGPDGLRQLRPGAYTPPTIRPRTATLRVVAQLSSLPALPTLAPRR